MPATIVLSAEEIKKMFEENDYLSDEAANHMTKAEFEALYGLEALKGMKKDRETLELLFGIKKQNENSLTYVLESKSNISAYYGKMTAYGAKKELNHSNGSWRQLKKKIDESEAIELAYKIKNSLITVLEQIDDSTTATDILHLMQKEEILPTQQGWLKKYLTILYPEKFMPMLNDDWVNRIFVPLGLKVSGDWYEDATNFAAKAKECGINPIDLSPIVQKCVKNKIKQELADLGIDTGSLGEEENLLINTRADFVKNTTDVDESLRPKFEEYLADRYDWESKPKKKSDLIGAAADSGEVKIWKISHGRNLIDQDTLDRLAARKVITMSKNTAPKGLAKVSQGEMFMKQVSRGDVFYLCYSNEIKLLGRITSDAPVKNSEKGGDWYEYSYEIIRESKSDKAYTGDQKWWTPNNNSTFWPVAKTDFEKFEEALLLPYFDMKLSDLIGAAADSGEEKASFAYKNPFAKKLIRSKNIIFRGAPGTGKSYLAKSLASDLVSGGKKDRYNALDSDEQARIAFVQFHPSYDYSDFVEGLRPIEKKDGGLGFERRDGVFMEFVNRAKKDLGHNYVFIIDEINRGEISKIFGELFFAIDPGYRGADGSVLTQYANLHKDSDEKFFIPENVYIVGTMNDIDRSVDTFDFAMRRRFRFIEIAANEHTDMLDNLERAELKDEAIARMKALNKQIEENEELGKNYQVGAAYFLKLDELDEGEPFDQLWSDYLEPLLQEYVSGMPDAQKVLEKFQAAYNAVTDDKNEEDESDDK